MASDENNRKFHDINVPVSIIRVSTMQCSASVISRDDYTGPIDEVQCLQRTPNGIVDMRSHPQNRFYANTRES